nr:radical SAM protein [uncultured Actinoplanes sp.]
MRALVIHPPTLPYGYTLHHRFQRVWEAAAYARRFHPGVRVIDAGLLNMLIGQLLSEFARDYDAVAFYCEPQMLTTVADLTERLRHIAPRTAILVYGPAAVCFPDEVGTLPVDAVGRRGDLDAQLRQFFDLVTGRDTAPANLARRVDGKWVEPTGPAETVPAAEWAFPPLDEMPMADIGRVYDMKEQPLTVAVTASRGCPYRCAFCATPELEGRPDRRRPADELAAFVAAHPQYQHWQFYSPTFTLDRRWCLAFFDELRACDTRIRWRCTTRVDRLDEELVRAMADTGCHMVGLGVETLGPAMNRIHKNIDRERTATAIRLLREHGIHTKAYVILGLPDQDIEEVRETVEFVTRLGARIRPTMYSPQGAADALGEETVAGVEAVSHLDRKSFLSNREHYGEFLRLAFDRRVSSPAM